MRCIEVDTFDLLRTTGHNLFQLTASDISNRMIRLMDYRLMCVVH